jgi:hypothetical protein
MQVRDVDSRLVRPSTPQLPPAYPASTHHHPRAVYPPCNNHNTAGRGETGELGYGAGDGRYVAVACGGAGDEKVELKLGQSWWAHHLATAMMDGAAFSGGCAWLLALLQ